MKQTPAAQDNEAQNIPRYCICGDYNTVHKDLVGRCEALPCSKGGCDKFILDSERVARVEPQDEIAKRMLDPFGEVYDHALAHNSPPDQHVALCQNDACCRARWLASVVWLHYRNRTDLDPIQQKHLELAMKAGAPFSKEAREEINLESTV